MRGCTPAVLASDKDLCQELARMAPAGVNVFLFNSQGSFAMLLRKYAVLCGNYAYMVPMN